MVQNKPAILWLIDDNEFVLNLVEKGLENHIKTIHIQKFTSFNTSIQILQQSDSSDKPQIILLDFDFGQEGTADDFLRIIDNLQLDLKTKIFLYTNNKNETEVIDTLSHSLVFGLIHKTTPLNALVQILVTELNQDV